MDNDQAISLQLSTDAVSVTVRIDGTPYSPDVFDDLARRALTLLEKARGKDKDTYESFEKVDEALERLEVLFSDDDD